MFSFACRKKRIEAAPYIRRLIDSTTPNRPALEAIDSRCEKRYCRALPVLLSPMAGDLPHLEGTFAGITQELSDSGLKLITLERLTQDEYCASLWPHVSELDAPLHLVCQTKECQQVTSNMWSTGLKLKWMLEIKDKAKFEILDQFARTYFRVS